MKSTSFTIFPTTCPVTLQPLQRAFTAALGPSGTLRTGIHCLEGSQLKGPRHVSSKCLAPLGPCWSTSAAFCTPGVGLAGSWDFSPGCRRRVESCSQLCLFLVTSDSRSSCLWHPGRKIPLAVLSWKPAPGQQLEPFAATIPPGGRGAPGKSLAQTPSLTPWPFSGKLGRSLGLLHRPS